VRLESNQTIGVGHLMRQLFLCELLAGINIKVEFISSAAMDPSFKILRSKNYLIHFLTSKFSVDNKSLVPLEDAYETIKILKNDKSDFKLLIVDFYQLEHKWEELVRPYVNLVLIVDDLANRKHCCDILIDPSSINKTDSYKSLVNSNTKLYLGANYIFFNKTLKKYKVNNHVIKNKNLVFFGGADFYNETYRVIKLLTTSAIFEENIFDVYLGLNNKKKEYIKYICSQYKNINCYDFSTDFHKTMAHCELSVGTGGMTMWERCYFGIPSVVTSTGRGQKEVMKVLNTKNCINYLGESSKVSDSKWLDSFEKTKTDDMYRKCLKRNSMDLVKNNIFLNGDRHFILNHLGLDCLLEI
jgi:UDP-2,4-diacetamido-2,4,6-trideoxy-beta-L-altropyranose hydrolase